jgi:hypothetical protein
MHKPNHMHHFPFLLDGWDEIEPLLEDWKGRDNRPSKPHMKDEDSRKIRTLPRSRPYVALPTKETGTQSNRSQPKLPH